MSHALRRAAVSALAVLLVTTTAVPAGAQPPATDRERTDAAAKRTAARLRALQREADVLAAQERTLLTDLRKLEVDRQIQVERLAGIERDRAATVQQLNDAEVRAAALAQRAATQLPDVEARLVQLYKLGRAGYWRLLLNADDMQALGRAYRTASTLTAIDRARVNEYYATLDALAKERKALHARAEEIEKLQAQATAAREAADKAVAARGALVKSIDARRDLNAQLTGELQAAQARLQSSVAELGSSGPALLPLRPFQGDLPWPAPGTLLRRFGPQAGSASGAGAVRNGIDLAVPEGQPVRSVHDGTVVFADQFSGYGNQIGRAHV